MTTKAFENFIMNASNDRIAKGQYVISDIRDNGCDFMTVVRYTIDNIPKKMICEKTVFVEVF